MQGDWGRRRRRSPSRLALAGIGLLSAAGPASAQLTPEQLEAVRRGATGGLHLPAPGATIPLLGPPELPLVEVHLDGSGPYRFLVDFGSNVVLVRRNVAEEAGLAVAVERENPIFVASSLRLGMAEFRDVWIGSYEELDVDGVIGYNLLMVTGVVMDYPGRALTLGVVDLPEPDGHTVLEYVVESRMPYVRARVGERELLLNFDTGATNHIVFPLFMTDSLPLEAAPQPGPALYNNQTGTVRNYVARLAADLVVGGHVIPRPVVLFDEAVEDAWLGSAILRDARLELDTERRVLRLTARQPLASPLHRTLGIGLGTPVDGVRAVTDVIPGSAAEGRIRRGDRILSIHGSSAAELDAFARRRLAADHDTVDVVLERDGARGDLRLPITILPQ